MYKINKKNKLIFVLIIIFLFIIIFYYFFSLKDNGEIFLYNDTLVQNSIKTNKKKEKKKENKIIIHIAGEVLNPGIIELKENSRISNAIEKAGGLTQNADISKINLAYLLEDGMKIYIPSHNEIEEEKNMENINENLNINNIKKENLKVNINSATQTELESLPGIGESTALKIINYREKNGKFKNVEDLKNVKGIGNSKFEKIKDLISIK